MNIGPSTWRNYFGMEWPAGTHRLLAALNVAKKWRAFEARGETLTSTPGDCLEEAIRSLLPSVKMSPWTKTMLHDFTEHDYYAMIGCGACGKSFAMSAMALTYWLPDPFSTTVIIGSSTLKDLSSRAWSPLLKLFTELKNNPFFDIPGKSVANMYSIVNEKDATIAESQTQLAGIHGRALDEGRIYGTHNEHVALFVDELGLVDGIEALKTALSNIRIGTKTFKFCSAANPLQWSAPQSQFYLPKNGETVTPATGSWESSMGYFVRHFNGYDSPVVIDPAKKAEYNFLMSREDIQSILENMCGGDPSHPTMRKMVVGFPLDTGTSTPTVLDPVIAAANRVTAAPDPILQGGFARELGLTAGVDPAWSSSGDSAMYAGCRVFEYNGTPVLDFTGRVSRIPLSAESKLPITRQLRDGVLKRMLADNGPRVDYIYVDSSGNQSLADDLDIYVGPGCGHINSSARASDKPLRNLDPRPAREHIKDRGAESWLVLSEFCKAGMVKGLTQAALDGLTQRRFALRPNSDEPCAPLRLEPKDQFAKRFHGKSPDETDACALAALAVKERLGILPFGAAPVPQPAALFPEQYAGPTAGFQPQIDVPGEYSNSFDDIGAYEG